MKRPVLLALTLTLALPIAAAARQADPQSHETTSQVPALTAMHEVIMPLWHEAWPAKDTKAMARILPDIDRHVKAVSAAKLPGILRDKQAAWDAGVKQLQAGAEAYPGGRREEGRRGPVEGRRAVAHGLREARAGGASRHP